MWQLDSDATNASSGSTPEGSEKGTLTTLGEDEAGTTAPPSNGHLCARLYLAVGEELSGFQGQRMVAAVARQALWWSRSREAQTAESC